MCTGAGWIKRYVSQKRTCLNLQSFEKTVILHSLGLLQYSNYFLLLYMVRQCVLHCVTIYYKIFNLGCAKIHHRFLRKKKCSILYTTKNHFSAFYSVDVGQIQPSWAHTTGYYHKSICAWDITDCWWDQAEWLERLTANAEVVTVRISILRHSVIWGVADEALLNKIQKKNPNKPPFYFLRICHIWQILYSVCSMRERTSTFFLSVARSREK